MCPFSSVFWNDKQTMVAWSHISSDVQINPLGSQPLNFETVEEIIWQNEWLDNKMMIRSHTLVKTWYTSDKLTAITRKFWNFRNSCTDLTLDHKMILDSIVVIQEAYEINGAPQRSHSQQADKSDCWKLIEQRITWGVTYHRTIGRMVIRIVMITWIIRKVIKMKIKVEIKVWTTTSQCVKLLEIGSRRAISRGVRSRLMEVDEDQPWGEMTLLR